MYRCCYCGCNSVMTYPFYDPEDGRIYVLGKCMSGCQPVVMVCSCGRDFIYSADSVLCIHCDCAETMLCQPTTGITSENT